MNNTFRVVLLGHPSSGKSTFLSTLRKDCAVTPDAAQRDLDNKLALLSRQKSLPPTRRPEGGPTNIRFECKLKGHDALHLETKDYPGEATLALNDSLKHEGSDKSAISTLKDDLRQSDAVLFFVDAYAVARSGEWNAWYQENARPLLQFIADVLSDERHHPTMLLFSRSDLVDGNFLNNAIADANKSIRELGLKGDVQTFRAFTCKAGHPPRERKQPDLADEYIAPGADFHSEPKPSEVIDVLYRWHKQSPRSWLSWLVPGCVIVIAVFAISLTVISQDKPVTARRIADVVKNIPDNLADEAAAEKVMNDLYVSPSNPAAEPPWSRFARRRLDPSQFDANDKELLNSARKRYAEKAANEAVKLADKLNLREKDMAWEPAETDKLLSVYEHDLRWLGAKAELASVAELRKKKLDASLNGLTDLNRQQLDWLANEYFRLDYAIPDAVIQRITEIVSGDAVDKVAALLKTYAGADAKGLKDLYEVQILKVIDDALGGKLTDAKRKELQEAKDYLLKLAKTQVLDLRIRSLIQDSSETFEPGVRIALGQQTSLGTTWKQFYYPITGDQTTKDDEYSKWPIGTAVEEEYSFGDSGNLNISWNYGERIQIDVWDFKWDNEELVIWDSDRLGADLEAQGEDLPGLTYLVFWAAHAHYNPGKGRSNRYYRLELKKEGNGYEMLHVPTFLKEANKKRRLP